MFFLLEKKVRIAQKAKNKNARVGCHDCESKGLQDESTVFYMVEEVQGRDEYLNACRSDTAYSLESMKVRTSA
ncbi:hypothetical protein CO726_24600 [Bacillus fungorum]|uniref:Uncharacterized protein n=1 Tax=Bacillus fungorum TaxID=2039284 RepID=A0A2G6Q7L3_9BACI|nr:hypothetical protein [Bacillus fungorum]PEQ98491.1 hypothetical protein CN477_26245 [Bacillus cereus]PIE92751.1 hypothetical protein CO726_24600 [Bacillus fungorum]